MRNALAPTVFACAAALAATTASAQVFEPGDPYARSQQYRMEQLRQQGDRLADYSAQYRANTRLIQLEMQQQRQSPPDVRLVETAPRTLDQERAARERATRAREQTVQGVTQIDDWLDRGPRQ